MVLNDFLVVLVGSWCFFLFLIFLVVFGGSWQFFVVLGGNLWFSVNFDGSR